VGGVIRLLLDSHQPWQYGKACIFGERLPDYLQRFKEIRNTEEYSALKKKKILHKKPQRNKIYKAESP